MRGGHQRGGDVADNPRDQVRGRLRKGEETLLRPRDRRLLLQGHVDISGLGQSEGRSSRQDGAGPLLQVMTSNLYY